MSETHQLLIFAEDCNTSETHACFWILSLSSKVTSWCRVCSAYQAVPISSFKDFLQMWFSGSFSSWRFPFFCSCSLGRPLVDWRSVVEWWGLIVAARKEHLWRAASTKYKGHRRLYSPPRTQLAWDLSLLPVFTKAETNQMLQTQTKSTPLMTKLLLLHNCNQLSSVKKERPRVKGTHF